MKLINSTSAKREKARAITSNRLSIEDRNHRKIQPGASCTVKGEQGTGTVIGFSGSMVKVEIMDKGDKYTVSVQPKDLVIQSNGKAMASKGFLREVANAPATIQKNVLDEVIANVLANDQLKDLASTFQALKRNYLKDSAKLCADLIDKAIAQAGGVEALFDQYGTKLTLKPGVTMDEVAAKLKMAVLNGTVTATSAIS